MSSPASVLVWSWCMALLQGGAGAFLVPIGRLSFLMGRYGRKTSLRNARVLVRARSVRDSACLLACSAYHTALASRSIARTRTGSGHIPSSASGHAGRLLFRYTSRARQQNLVAPQHRRE